MRPPLARFLARPLVGAVATVVTVAAGGLLSGCASPPSRLPPHVQTSAAAPAKTVQTLPTEPPVSVPDPGTSTPVDPAAPVFPDGPCSPSQLDVVAGPVEPALGYRQMRVRVTNHSRVPCILAGYATVVARGTGGTAFTNPRGRLTGDGSEVQTVPLDPGRSAHVDLGWRGDLAAAGVERVGILWLVVTDGSTPAPVQLDPVSPVDIVDGTEVRVGGWRPGAD